MNDCLIAHIEANTFRSVDNEHTMHNCSFLSHEASLGRSEVGGLDEIHLG